MSVGLAAGHVQTFRLPPEESDSDDDASTSSSRNGKGHIDTMWRTRRHKGSCRCLAFSVDGEMLYSAGTDGLVKMAKAESGQVENKIAIPLEKNGYMMSARVQCLSASAGIFLANISFLCPAGQSMRPP